MVALAEVPSIPQAGDYKYELIRVPVAELFVDHTCQRRVYKSRVSMLVKGWDWTQYSPIMIAARRGRYAVIDGQQRLMAAQELGIESLPAVLRLGADHQDEAKAFIGVNNAVPGGAGEKFRAKLVVKDPEAVDILTRVRNMGFDLTCALEEGQPRTVFCIDAVYALQQVYKSDMLISVLGAIMHAWGHIPHRDMISSEALPGMMLALRHARRREVSAQQFADRLKENITPSEARDRTADRFKSMNAGRSQAVAYAAILIEAYNFRLKGKALPPFTKESSRSNANAIAGAARAGAEGARNTETGRLQ